MPRRTPIDAIQFEPNFPLSIKDVESRKAYAEGLRHVIGSGTRTSWPAGKWIGTHLERKRATSNNTYPPAKVLAAQYVRMSTELQKYSTDNQKDAIRQFADEAAYEIVATYEDAGRSGLNIEGRTGLQRLLVDVEGGRANFEVVLVYDVCHHRINTPQKCRLNLPQFAP